jgi:hypothetical protein
MAKSMSDENQSRFIPRQVSMNQAIAPVKQVRDKAISRSRGVITPRFV